MKKTCTIFFLFVALVMNAQNIYTIAGNGTMGYSGDGGFATSAKLQNTFSGVAADASGNVYIADEYNNRVRMVNTAGIISTVAGDGFGAYSGDGGPATSAELNSPYGIALDGSGNLYICDGNNTVRKVNTAGIISTVAGKYGTVGYSGDGGPATSASLNEPSGLAIDVSGNIYIADAGNNRIRKVNKLGVITTMAGNGTGGFSGDYGPATTAELYNPYGVAVDKSGNIYIADEINNRIRKVDTSGMISTVAGTGTAGYNGDGLSATSAELYRPMGVAVNAFGNIFIDDFQNDRIREIDTLGNISTVAGNGTGAPGGGAYGGDGGPATSAELHRPSGISLDAFGNIFISDGANYRIREVIPISQQPDSTNTCQGSNVFFTIASTDTGLTYQWKVDTGTGLVSLINGGKYKGATTDTLYITGASLTMNGYRYVCSLNKTSCGCSLNSAVALLSVYSCNSGCGYITSVAGNGNFGYSGDGAAATSAELGSPSGVTLDTKGNIYIPDQNNNCIRKVNTSGIISTVAGNGTGGFSGDGAAATLAELNGPGSIVIDVSGNLYIADEYNNRIRKVNTAGIITTIAGNGTGGYSGDGATATAAELNGAAGIAIDTLGNVYIADAYNNRIRKVSKSGVISTIAGNGTGGFSGDGAAATVAEISNPAGVALDASGNVYIADEYNNRIRKVNTAGIITTIAGNGTSGYNGDGGSSTSSELSFPSGVAVDTSGSIYIADQNSNRIRMVNTSGIISTLAGNGVSGYNGNGEAPALAELNGPSDVALDKSGNVYIADTYNNLIRKVYLASCNLLPVSYFKVNNNVICQGSTVQFTDTSHNNPTKWMWFFQNGKPSSSTLQSPSVVYDSTGSDSVKLVIVNTAGKDSLTKKAYITVNPLPIVKVTGTSNITIGSSDVLTATGGVSYIWTSGSTNDTAIVKPLANTTYTVTGKGADGCTDTASFKVTVAPTGMGNISALNVTSLYPNPNNGVFTITIKNNDEKARNIEIYNTLGEKVFLYQELGTRSQLLINISNQANGIYLYRVISEKGELIGSGKLLIER